MMISDVEGGRSHLKSLGTDWIQGSKKFLIAVIGPRPEAERPEFVLGSELAEIEIVLESFPRC